MKAIFITLTILFTYETHSLEGEGFDFSVITERKSLEDAYFRWKKIFRPYNSQQSGMDKMVSRNLELLFALADLAVVEKVVLLEVIGKVHNGTLPRNHIHRIYFQEIFDEMNQLDLKDKRLKRVREDLIEAISHHQEVLVAWLEAAKNNEVQKVQNKSGRWVHPGTKKGDDIIRNLYFNYVKKVFTEEYSENIEAMERQFCVLIF